MSEQHTPEPWRTDSKNGFSGDIHDAFDNLVAQCSDVNCGDHNASRIVACVNACAGIPNEVLTTVGAFGGFGRDDIVQHVTKQRDKLLTALEKFNDAHEECTDFDGFTAQIVSMDDYHEAQEAIASVKGETK